MDNRSFGIRLWPPRPRTPSAGRSGSFSGCRARKRFPTAGETGPQRPANWLRGQQTCGNKHEGRAHLESWNVRIPGGSQDPEQVFGSVLAIRTNQISNKTLWRSFLFSFTPSARARLCACVRVCVLCVWPAGGAVVPLAPWWRRIQLFSCSPVLFWFLLNWK